MYTVGVRALKERTGEVLRRVWEGGETVAITRHGRVIAHLVPARPSSAALTDLSALWADLDALAAEIGARWPADQTAVEAVRQERREL